MTTLTSLLEDLTFPEGPRWHDGRLWLSDFYAHEVVALDLDGRRETMARVPGQPSGLGWTPDGRLMVVSMTDQKLMIADAADRPGALTVHGDLAAHARHWCNDMVVDAGGGAYVGNFGFDHRAGEAPAGTNLVRVSPDGRASVAAGDLMFPNGTVITPEGDTLIIAETYGRRLTAFDIAGDGTLSGRRVFADLGDGFPDGICLDAEGAVWVADPRANQVSRVKPNGTIDRRISTGDRGAYACMLGGADGRTLFICTNTGSGPAVAAARTGRIDICQVDVPHAGRP